MIDLILKPTLDWIRDDYSSNKFRFGVELSVTKQKAWVSLFN